MEDFEDVVITKEDLGVQEPAEEKETEVAEPKPEEKAETETNETEFTDSKKSIADEVKERNRKAYERRQAKKREQQPEYKGLINHYTGVAIENENDLADYKLMQKIDSEGGDAVQDFAKRRSTEKKEEEPKRDFELEINNEIEKIAETYNVDVEKLYKDDKDFREFADEYVAKGVGLTALVGLWQREQKILTEKAEQRAKELEKKSKTAPTFDKTSKTESGKADAFLEGFNSTY